ncbi:hypothetical protein [Absidia glauca]|uniref:Uncharacterized protein n=1 Tax=Absidia glauca TaxID=4829 RepID=A0A163MUP2_ABSGL|nr:hypothetical protein [Absidia glauca]
MQKANVSHGKSKTGRMLKREDLPCTRRCRHYRRHYRRRHRRRHRRRRGYADVDGNNKVMKMQRRGKEKGWRQEGY